jgi:hypothetical protein
MQVQVKSPASLEQAAFTPHGLLAHSKGKKEMRD